MSGVQPIDRRRSADAGSVLKDVQDQFQRARVMAENLGIHQCLRFADSSDPLPQVIGDGKDILVAPAAEVHQHDAVFSNLAGDFADAGQCMGWLQRRDDTFNFRAELEGLQRLLIGGGDIGGPPHIMQPGMLRPDPGIVESRGDGVGIDNLAIFVLK